MHEDAGRALPVQKLVALAEEVRLDGGLTIDFAASRRLGQPMVVLRMTEPRPDRRVMVLSRREREVAALVANGLSTGLIPRKTWRGGGVTWVKRVMLPGTCFRFYIPSSHALQNQFLS
jgi:hypothetical protein